MAQPSFLYTVAQLFYWDFRKMEEGSSRRMSDEKKYRDDAGPAQIEVINGDAKTAANRREAPENGDSRSLGQADGNQTM